MRCWLLARQGRLCAITPMTAEKRQLLARCTGGSADTLAKHPGVTEINVLAHSMGNWVTIEVLRTRSIREANSMRGRRPDKLRHAMLVAPDIDVDVFRIRSSAWALTGHRSRCSYPRTTSRLICRRPFSGAASAKSTQPREPYRSELERPHRRFRSHVAKKARRQCA